MNAANDGPADGKGISFFERYLTVWVALCIVSGIALGKLCQTSRSNWMAWRSTSTKLP